MPHRTQGPSAQRLLFLARARVHERLTRGIEFPILVVCAPAGFGKSTVLREFFDALRRPYRYLPLTAGHGDLLEFMRAFAECLGDLAPALQTSFMAVHGRLRQTQDAAPEIAAWAASHLEGLDLTLMVDGLENVAAEGLFTLLNELVDRTACARVRWILVTRTADRFPIARWLANDRMDLPIEDVDLALTDEDLAAAGGAAPGRIANWPAAVALALNDMRVLPVVSNDVDGHPYAYFAKRAFEALSDRERRFLLETCVYKHVDAELLRAAQWENAETMLAGLCARGAYLFSEGASEYRYHEVFRSFLEDQLRAGPELTYRRIRTAAAAVLRRVKRWADALEVYIDLQATTPLAELLSEHGFALVDRGEAALVYRSLRALGDGEFARFPIVLAVKASLESLFGSFDLAEAQFRHAVENADDPQARAAIVFRFATDLVRRDRRDAIDVLEPILAQGGHELALAVSLAGLLAAAYATHGQRERAASTIERALTQMLAVDDPAVHAKLYFQAGYVAFFGGDPGRAKRYASRAVEAALAAHLYDIAARALSILYNIAIDHEDDVRAGQRYLEQLASCSIKAGSRQLLIYARLGQFELEVLRGDLDRSARLEAALQALDIDYSVLASETLLPAQALRATWAGDFARAYGLLATTAELQITATRRARRYAEIALYAAAAGLFAEAEVAVRAAVTIGFRGEMQDRSVAFANAYVALTLVLLGRHRQAASVLSDLGRSGAVTPRFGVVLDAIRTINDRWKRGRYSTDLRAALRDLAAADFGGIGRLIEALPLPQTFHARFTRLAGPERDVLAHLSAGRSGAEIAGLTGCSAEAAGVTIGALCRKLGCSSPRQAVALARSAGSSRPRAAYAL